MVYSVLLFARTGCIYFNTARDAKFNIIYLPTHVKTKSKRLASRCIAHFQLIFALKFCTETLITKHRMRAAKSHNERECQFSSAQYILSHISLASSRRSRTDSSKEKWKKKKKRQKQIYSRLALASHFQSNTWQVAHRSPSVYFNAVFYKRTITYLKPIRLCLHRHSIYF